MGCRSYATARNLLDAARSPDSESGHHRCCGSRSPCRRSRRAWRPVHWSVKDTQLGTHDGLASSELATPYFSRSAFASSVRPSTLLMLQLARYMAEGHQSWGRKLALVL